MMCFGIKTINKWLFKCKLVFNRAVEIVENKPL